MSERRSGRVRKSLDYSKLDGASDDEFFEEEVKSTKKKKKDDKDENWSDSGQNPLNDKCKSDIKFSKEENKSKRTPGKRKTVSVSIPACSNGDTEKGQNQRVPLLSASNSPLPDPVLLTHKSVSQNKPTEVNSPLVKRDLPSPITPVPNSKPLYTVTPSSGLRLGLSRNQRLKSLHSNIRMA